MEININTKCKKKFFCCFVAILRLYSGDCDWLDQSWSSSKVRLQISGFICPSAILFWHSFGSVFYVVVVNDDDEEAKDDLQEHWNIHQVTRSCRSPLSKVWKVCLLLLGNPRPSAVSSIELPYHIMKVMCRIYVCII